MKSKLKLLLLWLAVFAACFVIIYLIVFFGGAKLFESGDPILIELGAALILSVFVSVILHAMEAQSKRIDALEKRVKRLEELSDRIDTLDNQPNES